MISWLVEDPTQRSCSLSLGFPVIIVHGRTNLEELFLVFPDCFFPECILALDYRVHDLHQLSGLVRGGLYRYLILPPEMIGD